jgi:hypothetical protein
MRLDAFAAGDVYIDDPVEEIKFRYEHATGKVYARQYGRNAPRGPCKIRSRNRQC